MNPDEVETSAILSLKLVKSVVPPPPNYSKSSHRGGEVKAILGVSPAQNKSWPRASWCLITLESTVGDHSSQDLNSPNTPHRRLPVAPHLTGRFYKQCRLRGKPRVARRHVSRAKITTAGAGAAVVVVVVTLRRADNVVERARAEL